MGHVSPRTLDVVALALVSPATRLDAPERAFGLEAA